MVVFEKRKDPETECFRVWIIIFVAGFCGPASIAETTTPPKGKAR